MRIIVLPVGRCRFLEENESGLRFRRNKIWRFTECTTPYNTPSLMGCSQKNKKIKIKSLLALPEARKIRQHIKLYRHSSHRPPSFHLLSWPFRSFEACPYIKLPLHPSPHGRGHRVKPWLTWSSPKRQSFKQDKVTAQYSEPLNSVWITATKAHKNRKPRAKFMISRNRTIIS